ncbi:ATP-binding protein [Ruegeria lacuscaerulensis]|uniref:sensor histidine kinase n=1 Tax=Ruegeria lacuscaerulensis TaxID=55218 RepID=UPI00147DA83C|nr:ATP-binding protein [Ruegeria lacuscaerulensis]
MIIASGRKSSARRQLRFLTAIYSGIILIAIVSWYILDRAYVTVSRRAQQESLHQLVEMARVRADERLRGYGLIVEGLVNILAHDSQLRPADFDSLADIVIHDNPSIINVARAQGYVVTDVYPVALNSDVLGVDFRNFPEAKEDYDKTIASGEFVISGPIDLIQGGRGLIYRRAPMTGKNEVYSVVVDFEAFLNDIGIADNSQLTLSAIRKITPEGDSAENVYGDPSVWEVDPVLAEISLGEISLQYGMAPANGWNAPLQGRQIIGTLILVLASIGLFGVNYARRLIKERSQARRQLLKAIESIKDGFVIFDEDDRLSMCNDEYLAYYSETADLIKPGAKFEDIIRAGAERGLYAEAVGNEEEWIAQRIERHKHPGEPFEQQLKDGRWLKIAEAKTHSGETVGFRVDVTQLKNAQKAAEAANQAKSDFLNNISHEFRTPLSVIVGYLAFLKSNEVLPSYKALSSELAGKPQALAALEGFSDEVGKFAIKAERSGKHLLELINSVLDWALVSENSVELDRSQLNLQQLLASLIEDMQQKAQEKGIELRVSLCEVWVDGDELRLRQAFLNLLSNALKFTETGFVAVSMTKVVDRAYVTVQDSGPGIPEDQMKTIFQRFAQVDTSLRRNHAGTGLGLAITNSFVELHGGQVEVQSTPGEGSIFTVELPSLEMPPQKEDAYSTPEPAN